MNIDFDLDLNEKIGALKLSEADAKKVVDIVFWAVAQVAPPRVNQPAHADNPMAKWPFPASKVT